MRVEQACSVLRDSLLMKSCSAISVPFDSLYADEAIKILCLSMPLMERLEMFSSTMSALSDVEKANNVLNTNRYLWSTDADPAFDHEGHEFPFLNLFCS